MGFNNHNLSQKTLKDWAITKKVSIGGNYFISNIRNVPVYFMQSLKVQCENKKDTLTSYYKITLLKEALRTGIIKISEVDKLEYELNILKRNRMMVKLAKEKILL